MPDERPYRSSAERHPSRHHFKPGAGGFGLIIIQSIACVVVLLIVWIFSAVGGSAFAQLKEAFRKTMMDNSLLDTLASWVDGPADKLTSSSDTSDTSQAESSDATSDTSKDTASTTSPVSTPEDDETNLNVSSTSDNQSMQNAVAVNGSSQVQGSALKNANVQGYVAPKGVSFAKLRVNQAARLPVKAGVITSVFGYRDNPTGEGLEFHKGLDIGGEEGTEIHAMFFGVVSEAGTDQYLGNYVKIFHGGDVEIVYAHCSKLLVKKGMVVRAGEVVAKMGSTGNVTGTHLHIEVHKDGTAYNPASVVPLNAYD